MSRKLRSVSFLVVLILVLVGLFSTGAQTVFAQAPLNFGNNFFVTGDYIVAGAYNVNQKFTTVNGASYTVGTINVPDKNPNGVANPGITGATSVPTGAQIVAAFLYWQTVEKVGLAPAAPGTGQNVYFLPLANAGSFPKGFPGYAISGTSLSGSNTVSWSSGGCTGGSTGKVLKTYRADVIGGLPVDGQGNSLANGSFQVLLPSTGNSTPLTLGATLVIIYRVLSGPNGPTSPLNAIVIYDGDYSQNNAMLTMTQQLQGFYDADKSTISRLTHIVGNGKSNKFQTVYLSSGANPFTKLSPPYGNGLPYFPGWYGTWDNPTWTFTSGSPLAEDSSFATTQVVPSMSNQGCVSWGAVIVSTTVKDPDNDGILQSWKTDPRGPGYCDAALNNGVCSGHGDPAWVDLTGAAPGHQDIFLQYDYLCSDVTGAGACDVSTVNDSLSAVASGPPGFTTYTGSFSPAIPSGTVVGIAGFASPGNNGQFNVLFSSSTQIIVNNPIGATETHPGVATYAKAGDVNYSFDPRLATDAFDGLTAVQKVANAFENPAHPVYLHAMPGNAIMESQSTCADTDIDPNTGYLSCPFPNEAGTVGFREGLTYIKNQNVIPQTGVLGCTPNPPYPDPTCLPVFEHGKKDSYHYALFSHAVGLPNWFLSDGSLKSISQVGSTVTFTTASPHGLSPIAGDTVCTAAKGYIGRVTVVFSTTNPNLNGTFCAKAVGASGTQFSISVNGSAVLPSYTIKTDPNLAVANGQVTSMSGYSDVGGQNSVISLGYGNWGPPNNPFADGNKWQVKAGTFMHELGHTLGLTHGGTFYNSYNAGINPANNNFTATYEVNCKPNVQSIMSYVFQFDLLQSSILTNPDGSPKKVVDYSEDASAPGVIPTLAESKAEPAGTLNGLTYANTSWFVKSAVLPPNRCDGSPTATGQQGYSYTTQPVSAFTYSAGQDINFNGSTTDVMNPHNEWEGTPANNGPVPPVGSSPGIDLRQISALGTVSTTGIGGEAGAPKPWGGGGAPHPLGGGGGITPYGNGGGAPHPLGGGGAPKPWGGGGATADVTHNQATSYPRPAQNLFIAQEEASPRLIDLGWSGPSLGTVDHYNIYRAVTGQGFSQHASVPGAQTSFQDTVTCNTAGYEYQVTAVTINDSNQQIESSPSNTVPAAGQPLLTGCYTAPINVAVQASGVQGDIVPVTWTLTDDEFVAPGGGWQNATTGNPVTNLKASTLVANGPLPGNCGTSGSTTILLNGAPQTGVSTFVNTNPATGLFTFNWDTDAFCAGTYTLQLSLDSGQPVPVSSPLKLSIDVNDHDNPHVTTLGLPNGTVAVPYTDTLTEEGGVAPFTWTVPGLPGGPPGGISQQPAGSPTFSGTACFAGSYSPIASVTDAKGNAGSQGFSLVINKGASTTSVMSSANPSVFQQTLTYTVTVASSPASACVPTGGTVTLFDGVNQIGSAVLSNGSATFAIPLTSYNPGVGVHSITATYGGDGNFTGSTSAVLQQTVNPAPTSLVFNSLSPSPQFVGQPITFFYTFSVPAPGAGAPTPPSGNITVAANDGSSCTVAAAAALLGPGMCILSPAPKAAGNVTYTVNYPGDGNFVASGANGNYNVYQLVFTTQPSNTGVGLPITPAVVVTAEDSTNVTLATFTGGVTVAIGTGPGTLSGTLTQTASSGVATFNDLSINQIANGYTLKASPDGVVFDATSGPFNIDTFYVDNKGNFGTLDLPTGTVTQIGAATLPNSTGVDLTPGLLVYTYNTLNQLNQVTPSTGLASPVGGTGSNPDQVTTGATTDGSYYAIDSVTGILYSINLATGATNQIGTGTGTGVVVPSGCTLESSLSGSASALYYTVGYSGASCSSPLQDTLYVIDPTGVNPTSTVAITVGGSGTNGFVGSAFVGSTLYGFTSVGQGQEYSINPATGIATFLYNITSTNTTAAAPVVAAGDSQ